MRTPSTVNSGQYANHHPGTLDLQAQPTLPFNFFSYIYFGDENKTNKMAASMTDFAIYYPDLVVGRKSTSSSSSSSSSRSKSSSRVTSSFTATPFSSAPSTPRTSSDTEKWLLSREKIETGSSRSSSTMTSSSKPAKQDKLAGREARAFYFSHK